MVMVLAGNGSITGVSSMPTSIQFGGTLATANAGITSPSLPIGSVLQQYTTQLTAYAPSITGAGSLAQITSSNSTEIQSFTITPVGVNSRFICQTICTIDSSTNLYHEQTGLFVGSSLVGASWLYRRVSGTEPLLHHAIGTYTASGSGSFTLSYRVHTYGASPTLRFGLNASVNPTPGVCTLMVTEIKTQ